MVASNSDQYFSSLSCEVRIIKAKSVELKSKNGGRLFVRYYLSAGNDKRIQLNSQEIIPSTSHDLTWNESFSLECLGTEDSIKNMSQQSVVFELRWRDKTSSMKNLLGKKSKSLLLGRAEVPWKTVLESPNMELENWVVMVPSNNNKVNSARVVDEDHVKPVPSLQVSMKVGVQAPKMAEKIKKKKSWVDKCGCSGHDHSVGAFSCADYELFVLLAAFEAL